jgi:Raf kinase inhibitor-like YbhB/YbcL family protein
MKRYFIKNKILFKDTAAAIIPVLLALVISVSGCSPAADSTANPASTPPTFSLSSESFACGDAIPARYTCAGLNTSPQLNWSKGPQDTQYYIVLMEDLDADSPEAHWIVYNIPSDVRDLHDGISHNGILDTGALQGRNYLGKLGYYGPCPADGAVHRYRFTLYAVDAYLKANAADRATILEFVKDHTLAQAELTGTYKP